MSETAIFWNDLKSGKFVSMVKEASQGQTVSSSHEVYNIMKPLFAKQDDIEVVYFIFLDSSNNIVSIEKMFSGTINKACVYTRELIKQMIFLKATACIMVHNHPSGNTKPSPEDELITAKVVAALLAIDATFHDHVIVGDGFHSMSDSGCLGRIREKVDLLRDFRD